LCQVFSVTQDENVFTCTKIDGDHGAIAIHYSNFLSKLLKQGGQIGTGGRNYPVQIGIGTAIVGKSINYIDIICS